MNTASGEAVFTARTTARFNSDFNVISSVRHGETRIFDPHILNGDLVFALIPETALRSLGNCLLGIFTKHKITVLFRAFSATEVRTLSAAAVRILSNVETKSVAKTLGFERVKNYS